MIGWLPVTCWGIIVMNYDWSGARSRRMAYFKRTTLFLVSISLPASLGLWPRFFH